MNDKNVDRFLLSHKVEIEDKGFSDRVMQSLPENRVLQRRLSILWNIIFIILLAFFCWKIDVLDMVVYDMKAFIATLPTYIFDSDFWYAIALILGGMYGVVFYMGKKLSSM